MLYFIKISISSFIFSYKKYFSHLCVSFKFSFKIHTAMRQLREWTNVFEILWYTKQLVLCCVVLFLSVTYVFEFEHAYNVILWDSCVRFNTHTAAQSQIYCRSTRVTVVWFRCENVRILIGINFCIMNEIYLLMDFCGNLMGIEHSRCIIFGM